MSRDPYDDDEIEHFSELEDRDLVFAGLVMLLIIVAAVIGQ